MGFQINPFSVVSFINSGVALLVALYCWPRREIRAAFPLILTMGAVLVWGVCAGLEMAAVNLHDKVFWNKLAYLGILPAPVFFLLFAVEYNNLKGYLTRRKTVLLFVVPVLTFLFAVTNDWHGLVWSHFSASSSDHNFVGYAHGPLFWLGVIGYSYLLNAVAAILMIRAALQYPPQYRNQTIAILVGAGIPVFSNIFSLTSLSPIPELDITPLGLAFSGVLLGWAVLRLQLLELIPVARATLVENMPIGLLVFDQNHRIVDINPAAAHMSDQALRLGMSSHDLPGYWQALAEGLSSPQDFRLELQKPLPQSDIFDIQVVPLNSASKSTYGHMVVIQDISQSKQTEAALRLANERLHDLATHDELTGLFNRRFLVDSLDREFARAQREHALISVAIFDIDHFKTFNESYGHQAGDALLKSLGSLLNKRTRQQDIACRYGGEEFLLILTGASPEQAVQRAEAIRKEFAELVIRFETKILQATLTAGVANFPRHGMYSEEVLSAAERALLSAKSAGRNRTAAANS